MFCKRATFNLSNNSKQCEWKVPIHLKSDETKNLKMRTKAKKFVPYLREETDGYNRAGSYGLDL